MECRATGNSADGVLHAVVNSQEPQTAVSPQQCGLARACRIDAPSLNLLPKTRRFWANNIIFAYDTTVQLGKLAPLGKCTNADHKNPSCLVPPDPA